MQQRVPLARRYMRKTLMPKRHHCTSEGKEGEKEGEKPCCLPRSRRVMELRSLQHRTTSKATCTLVVAARKKASNPSWSPWIMDLIQLLDDDVCGKYIWAHVPAQQVIPNVKNHFVHTKLCCITKCFAALGGYDPGHGEGKHGGRHFESPGFSPMDAPVACAGTSPHCCGHECAVQDHLYQANLGQCAAQEEAADGHCARVCGLQPSLFHLCGPMHALFRHAR